METPQFFETLAGSALDDELGALTIWTLRNKASRHFSTSTGAALFVEEERAQGDLYYAPALRRKGLDGSRRGGLSDLSCLLALWADIDVHVAGIHSDESLPPSKDAALQIVAEIGRHPSFVIDSGNGLQALWLLSEPWDLRDEKERRTAAELSRRWEATLQAAARKLGYGYDVGNHNLDRILRVPGTLNYKGEKPKEVRLLAIGHGTFAPDELEEVCVDLAATAGASPASFSERQAIVEKEGGTFTIDRAAKAPSEELVGMLDADPEGFGGSWNMTRKFASGDDSPSAYTMSLASICAGAGWKNQAIADLVCAFWRRWREKKDPSYDVNRHGFQWFVTLLYKSRRKDEVKLDLPPADAVEVENAATAPLDQKARWLSERLGFKFIRIEQRERFETVAGSVAYFLICEEVDEPILLGGKGILRKPNSIRDTIETVTAHRLVLNSPAWSVKRWPKEIHPVLSQAVVLVEDASPAETVRGFLAEYLTSRGHSNADTAKLALRERRQPYIENGSIGLHLTPLLSFVRDDLGRKDIHDPTLRRLLSIVGFEKRTVGTEGGSRTYHFAPLDSQAVPDDARRVLVTSDDEGEEATVPIRKKNKTADKCPPLTP